MSIDRFVLPSEVKEVKILKVAKKSFKDKNDEVKTEYEDLGWFVTLDRGNVSFSVGNEDPGWRPGDKINLIIERPKNDT